MLRSLGEYDTSYEYVNIAYVKGALMFEGLRSGIGDDMFFKGLKTYFKENSFKIVTPDDLVGAFERVGANTNGFFKSWLNGEVIL
jgi:aminopeptidase N